MFHAIIQKTSDYCLFQNLKWLSVQVFETLGNIWFIELGTESKIYPCGTQTIVEVLMCIGILIDVGGQEKGKLIHSENTEPDYCLTN